MNSSSSNIPSSQTTPKEVFDRNADLPHDYNVTRLVLMPRDPQWMHAYWEVAPYTWEEAEKTFGGDVRSGRSVLRLHTENGAVKKIFDVDIQLDARNWYIFSPAGGGAWNAELGLLLPDGRFVLLATSNRIQLPVGQISDKLDEKWGMLKAEWEKLYALSGSGRLGGGSLDVTRMLAQYWELMGAVSSWPSSISGSWKGAPERHKSFWLAAECELIVYGATEPDARVTIQGQPVQLSPDGTFSLRFALPDGRPRPLANTPSPKLRGEGRINIPVAAANRDGDMSESIEFTVNRCTKKDEEQEISHANK